MKKLNYLLATLFLLIAPVMASEVEAEKYIEQEENVEVKKPATKKEGWMKKVVGGGVSVVAVAVVGWIGWKKYNDLSLEEKWQAYDHYASEILNNKFNVNKYPPGNASLEVEINNLQEENKNATEEEKEENNEAIKERQLWIKLNNYVIKNHEAWGKKKKIPIKPFWITF